MGAQGTATIDFGAFPGASDTSVAVAAAGILAGSLVEAWLYPTATADHSADEHLVEQIKVRAGAVVAGVGFTIYAFCDAPAPGGIDGQEARGQANSDSGNVLIYGQWTVAWVWN
jgi:hypothetical protein